MNNQLFGYSTLEASDTSATGKSDFPKAQVRLGAKALLHLVLLVAAAICSIQTAKAQVSSYFTYTSNLNSCVPNVPGSYKCDWGDVTLTYNPSTGSVSGTVLGGSVSQYHYFAVTFFGNEPANWNWLVLNDPAGDISDRASNLVVGFVGSDNTRLYDLASSDGGKSFAFSTTPGTWAPGLPINAKSLGGYTFRLFGRGGTQSGGGNSGSGGSNDGNLNWFQCLCGDPIDIATGNVFEQVTDYETAGQNKLGFTRYYNSLGNKAPTLATELGSNWRSTYDRYLRLTTANGVLTTVVAERANGQQLTFSLQGGVWTADSDVDLKLTSSGSIWTLTDTSDDVETYAVTNGAGLPQSVKMRNGYTQNLTYTGTQLSSVTDSYGRTLGFTYTGNLLTSVGTPDGSTLTYGYAASGTNALNPATLDRLASITYSTTPATSQTYLYADANLPFALTGVIDENGNRTSTWTYDDVLNRGASSQSGNGANLTSFVHNSDGTVSVTGPLGAVDTYTFATLQGVSKVTGISRAATSTTTAATEKFTYDAKGFLASQTNWNGNLTTYVKDAHGQPTTIVEASGTAQARTTTITYHPTFHLPVIIVTPGLTSAFTYDANGELLTKTLTDTTATIVPYSTNGTKRKWTNTWSNSLLASSKGPRTDVAELTSFAYDISGALISTTNALGQITRITAHTGGGLPLTVIDANGVTTNLFYNARQWLLTSTLSTGAGPLTTTLTYDAAGNLVKTTLPDGSAVASVYDKAHRLTAISDLFSQSVSYTLDANGDRTETDTLNSSNVAKRKHFGTFDAQGRMLTDVGGVGQTTGFTYDNNGNTLTVTDPLSRVTQQAFDPLNRLIRTIDAAGGITKLTYDAHDRPVTVVDPNSGSTTFIYDGFGDVLQRISPDTGKTVYRYDLAGNLTQSVDATGATANYTYDALDRVLTTAYPADAAENVAYTYDQAGHGFGIGRLTSVTDAAGSLSRSYDERGNILKDKRIHGAATLLTSNTYDAASRIGSITYPSGWKVSYTRDAMGRITATTATSPGGVTQSIASGIAYQPFGPVNAMTYGNGVAETRSFDLDDRLLNLSDTGAVALQNLTYTYNAANDVSKIADGVTAGNMQNLGYDVLDHLTGATGSYGSLSYSYSPIGNRLTQTAGGVLTNYTYAAHSNQLASFKTGSTTDTVTTTVAGNISGFSVPFGPITNLKYNQANRLATASAGASQLAQYAYDAFGHRSVKVGSITGTTLYQYDGAGHLLEENDGAGTSRVDYVYLDDQPIATIQPTVGKVYFLHDDRLGTPQLATDSTKAIVWTASYQPFGYTSTGIGAIVQNLRLPGQEFDAETGLYRNGLRDYVPALGRYLESDRIGLRAGMNTYQFVYNNALKWTDRWGLNSDNRPIASPVIAVPDRDIPLPPVGSPQALGWQFVRWNSVEYRKWLIYHGWHSQAVCYDPSSQTYRSVNGPEFVDSPPWATMNMLSVPDPYSSMQETDLAKSANDVMDLVEATTRARESGSLNGPATLTAVMGQQLCGTLQPLQSCPAGK